MMQAAMVPVQARRGKRARQGPALPSECSGPATSGCMQIQALVAFAAVAAVAILSPGPAALLALRNSMAWGPRIAI